MKSIRAALLLGSGEDVPRHPPALNLAETFIICADGGAVLARKWGVAPDLILGDLDSLDGEILTYWQEKGVPVQRVPAEKDETDLELAVDFALEQGVEKIILVGAWGSRVDHALGNLELLYRLAQGGTANELLTRDHRLIAFTSSLEARVRPGSYVSLVPLTPVVRRVWTQGLAYPLTGQDVTKGKTLSISNQAQGEEIKVELSGGVLLAVLEQ